VSRTHHVTASARDAADPLAGFIDRFVVPDPALVYLDGNSLGRAPRAAIERVARTAAAEWGGEIVRGWDHWLDLPLRVGDRLAAGVLGAATGTVVVADSTTVNLYRVASAALDDRADRRVIVADRADFPTDRYVVEGLARARDLEVRWLDGAPVEGLAAEDVARALGDDVALVVLSLVSYRSAAIVDLEAVEAAARDAGAHVLWDLSHAAGAIPVELARRDVGLAVGCSYKFLFGGPGAPAWLYVAPRLQDRLRPPIQGWFARADQFAMGDGFVPRDGIAGWLTGTPSILAMVAVEEGVALVAEAGIEAIRAKSTGLTTYAIDRLDADLAPLGCSLGGPRDDGRRGAHVAIRHPDARRLTAALIERGVVPDFREPDVIRFGLSPLTTSYADVDRGVSVLRELLLAS
jgi:kynureninase